MTWVEGLPLAQIGTILVFLGQFLERSLGLYLGGFFKTYLEETRVISESKDSAGLNDMGGGVATGSNCTL